MGVIVSGVGGARSNASASGGKVYPSNVINAAGPTLVAPANPQRTQIVFHNPGDVDLFVYPQYFTVGGTQVAAAPTVGALGGTFRIYANGGTLTVSGECQMAWYALAASAAGKPITVQDSNT